MIPFLVVVAIVAVVLVVGFAIGMLTAPHIERLAQSDEEPRDGDDPATD